MSELWQVETGDYGQRHTSFVADTPELAEKRIHERHLGAGYKSAVWEPMKDTSWDGGDEHYREFTVRGHVVMSNGYEYDDSYEISPIEYVTLEGE